MAKDIDISIDQVKTLSSDLTRYNKGIINVYAGEIRSIGQELNRIKSKYSNYSYVVSKANDVQRLLNELENINKDITSRGDKLSTGLKKVISLTIESEQQAKTLIQQTNTKMSGKINNGKFNLRSASLTELESTFDAANTLKVGAITASGVECAIEMSEYKNKLDHTISNAVYRGGKDTEGIYKLGTDWKDEIFKANYQYIANLDFKSNLVNINAQRMLNSGMYSESNSETGALYSWDPSKFALTGPGFTRNSTISAAAFEDVTNGKIGDMTAFEAYSRMATFQAEAKMNSSLFMIGNNRIQGPVLQGDVSVHAALAETGGSLTIGDPDTFGLQGNANVAAVTGNASSAIDFEAFDMAFDPVTGLYMFTPPSFSAEASASASVIEGSADIKLGNDYANINAKAEGAALTANAEVAMDIDLKEGDLYVKAEAGAAVLSGEVSSGFSILGLDIDVTLEGEAIAAGVKGGIGKKDDSFEIEIGASLLAGGSVKLKVDWGDVKDTIIDWWDSLW